MPCLHPEVPRRAHPTVLPICVLYDPHLARSHAGIFFCDMPALVGRAVIYQYQLPVRVALREDALDRLANEFRSVEKDHHYCYFRFVAHTSTVRDDYFLKALRILRPAYFANPSG